LLSLQWLKKASSGWPYSPWSEVNLVAPMVRPTVVRLRPPKCRVVAVRARARARLVLLEPVPRRLVAPRRSLVRRVLPEEAAAPTLVRRTTSRWVIVLSR
jgi:hypothetical protein